jgi:hypothetical protein
MRKYKLLDKYFIQKKALSRDKAFATKKSKNKPIRKGSSSGP